MATRLPHPHPRSPRPQLSRGRGRRRSTGSLVVVVVVAFTLAFLGPLYWMVTGGAEDRPGDRADPADAVPAAIPTRRTTPTPGPASDLGQAAVQHRLLRGRRAGFQLVFDVAAAYALSKLRPVFGNVDPRHDAGHADDPGDGAGHPAVRDRDRPADRRTCNLLDTPWAIWLPAVANAFNIFLLKRFFDSIPKDLLQAAAIDGAGPLRTLWSIILPMSRPDPRRRLDLRGDRGVEGLPLADAGAAVARHADRQRRHLRLRRPALGQNVVIAAAVIAADPDHHLLPDLPAEHHVRPHRRQPQGLTRPHARRRAATVARSDRGSRYPVRTDVSRQRPAPTAVVALAPPSTRSTRAASPTATATASATSPASGPAWTTWPTSASTRSGSARGTPRRMADAGYDVADYRDIDPVVRHPGRGRGADRRGARARHPDHRRHRAQPLLRRAPVVPGGAGRRARVGRARDLFWFRPGRGERRRAAAQQLAVHLRRPGLDPDHEPDGTRRVVPAPVRPRAARPQLGQPRGARGVRGRAAVLVRPRRRRRPHRLGRPAR